MAKEMTTFTLWEKLQMIYEKISNLSKLILIWQLLNMKMRETEPETFHINTFNWVLTELSAQDLNFDEEVKTLVLLLSFPTSWEDFYTIVINSSSKLTLDEGNGAVMSKELRGKSMGLIINEPAKTHHLTRSIE